MATENEHIKNLIAARDKEVADRRDVAGKLAEKHQRGHAEDMREAIILIQNAIEAIDRAIADERRIGAMIGAKDSVGPSVANS
jgi:hypothetical protein